MKAQRSVIYHIIEKQRRGMKLAVAMKRNGRFGDWPA